MPRKSRNILSTEFFHIMVQGINKEYIFSKHCEKEKYLNLINNKIKDYNISIISYCIMNNHTHLLLHCKNIDEISKFMSRINTQYAMWYNTHNSRVGYVFRNRFLSEPIYNFRYLYNCIFYIHNNPVNANLVKKPYEYKYSSYNDYMNKTGIFNLNLLTLLNLTEADYLYTLSKSTEPISIKETSISSISPEIIVDEFIKLHNIEIQELLSNSILLRDLIQILKNQCDLSMSKIGKLFNISRSKLYRILK